MKRLPRGAGARASRRRWCKGPGALSRRTL